MKISKNKLILLIPITLLIVSIFYFLEINASSEEYISGIFETDEIDISSKIPGRIDTIFVERGDKVVKGQILARLESNEMDAKVEQAKGMMEATRAKYLMACNGARIEEINATENLYLQAQAQFDFASKSWERIQNLYRDKVISLQEKDEAEFKFKAAKEQMEAAKSKFELVKSGARAEEIIAAKSLLHQAENVYKEALSYHNELAVVSPTDGEISNIYNDLGEIINSGYPIFSLTPTSNNYLLLNVREDKLKYFSLGKTFQVIIPALGNRVYKFKVSFISSMGDFANWRPTNQKGDFDLRTFEVHLTSMDKLTEIKPGMTGNIKISQN